MLQRKIEDEKRSKGKPKNIDEDFLIKTPKIRMDIIGVTRAQQRYFDQMFIWYKSINEQIRSMMKAGTTQQKLLVLMDNYIQSLRTNSNTFVRNANRCYLLSKAISSALFLFKDLNRTSTETDEYLLKICELLSFYTFLELKFSSKFSSSKVIIAERISSNYDIHLKDVNIFYTLRVFLCIPTLFNEKEIMSKIFQKYLNRHPQITQRKLPDRLYCMYLMSYSKWLSLENDNYERIKICESANKNVQPMESLRLNKSYAPFLPVYEHTDSNATKYILSHRINLKLLTKVLKNDVCRKENIVLIDLSGSDLTNTSNILEDSSWTSILTSEKSTSVKLESPSIIATIDLTEEQSSSWEVSWLSELIRKSRASMPRNTLNVIPPKLVHTFEVINIEDDDEHCGETVGTLSFNSNECEENLKSIVRTKMVDGNNSNIKTGSTEGTKLVPERNGKENNLVFNDKAQEKINQNSIQDMQEKGNLHSDMIMKNLMVNNSTNKTVKIRERHKDYLPQCQPDRSALWTKVSYSAASAKNFELHTDKKTDTSKNLTNVPVEQSDPSKSFSTYNNLIPANSSRVINIENCKSTSAISTNEEDVEDINSPPVECFSESDADELVQLIDKNTKDSNGTNLFYNRKNHHNSISQISNSHKVSVSNSHMRKVSFAKLPEKHIAASSHFSAKNLRNVDQTETEKECNQSTILSPNNTTLSPNNTILPNSDLNFNQPKALSNSLEIASQSSSVQEIVSSTDRTSLPIADLNRQNKISGMGLFHLDESKMSQSNLSMLSQIDCNDTSKYSNKFKANLTFCESDNNLISGNDFWLTKTENIKGAHLPKENINKSICNTSLSFGNLNKHETMHKNSIRKYLEVSNVINDVTQLVIPNSDGFLKPDTCTDKIENSEDIISNFCSKKKIDDQISLPLKKRRTLSQYNKSVMQEVNAVGNNHNNICNEQTEEICINNIKDSDKNFSESISYPSTPMLSIANFESMYLAQCLQDETVVSVEEIREQIPVNIKAFNILPTYNIHSNLATNDMSLYVNGKTNSEKSNSDFSENLNYQQEEMKYSDLDFNIDSNHYSSATDNNSPNLIKCSCASSQHRNRNTQSHNKNLDPSLPDIDIQNFIDLSNYKMNAQHLSNFLHNSQINLQAKQAVLNQHHNESSKVSQSTHDVHYICKHLDSEHDCKEKKYYSINRICCKKCICCINSLPMCHPTGTNMKTTHTNKLQGKRGRPRTITNRVFSKIKKKSNKKNATIQNNFNFLISKENKIVLCKKEKNLCFNRKNNSF